jgi:hypothetical protein
MENGDRILIVLVGIVSPYFLDIPPSQFSLSSEEVPKI